MGTVHSLDWVDINGMRNNLTLTRDILAELHYYEEHRGGERRPRRDPGRCVPPAVADAVDVYERSRGLA